MYKPTEFAAILPSLLETRRYLHQHPETGFDVIQTHDFVVRKLHELGIETIQHVGKNSVVGILKNGKGPIIGLRADMDALPLTEENRDLDYCSQVDGKMHACGHDAHTAMLLSAAAILTQHKEAWKGTVKFIFQEAEEGPMPGGAEGVVHSGIVDDVEAFFAFHVAPQFESGTVCFKVGPAMAGADTVRIRLVGKGSHAAYPHLSIDVIQMQAAVVIALQQIHARRVNPLEPLVISLTQVHSGTTHNILPESAFLEGTVRTFSQATRKLAELEIRRIVEGIVQSFGGKAEIDYEYGYAPTVNTPTLAPFVKSVVEQTLGATRFRELTEPSMGAEDFSKFIDHRQGIMLWLGTQAGPMTAYGLHHPKFNLDEKALLDGVTILVNLVCSAGRIDSCI